MYLVWVFLLLITTGLQAAELPTYTQEEWSKIGSAEDVDLVKFIATINKVAKETLSLSHALSLIFCSTGLQNEKDQLQFLKMFKRWKKEYRESFLRFQYLNQCLDLKLFSSSLFSRDIENITPVFNEMKEILLDICEGVDSLKATSENVSRWPLIKNIKSPTIEEIYRYFTYPYDSDSYSDYFERVEIKIQVTVDLLNQFFEKIDDNMLDCNERVSTVLVKLIQQSAFFGVYSSLSTLHENAWRFLKEKDFDACDTKIFNNKDRIIQNDNNLKSLAVCNNLLLTPQQLFLSGDADLLNKFNIKCFDAQSHSLKKYVLTIATDSTDTVKLSQQAVRLLLDNHDFMYFVCYEIHVVLGPQFNPTLSTPFLLSLAQGLSEPMQEEYDSFCDLITPSRFYQDLVIQLINNLFGFVRDDFRGDFNKPLMTEVVDFLLKHTTFSVPTKSIVSQVNQNDFNYLRAALDCKDVAALKSLSTQGCVFFNETQQVDKLAQIFGFIKNPYNVFLINQAYISNPDIKLDPKRIMQTDLWWIAQAAQEGPYSKQALQIIADQILTDTSPEAQQFIVKLFQDSVVWENLSELQDQSIRQSLMKILNTASERGDNDEIAGRASMFKAQFFSDSLIEESDIASGSSSSVNLVSRKSRHSGSSNNSPKSHSLPMGGAAIRASLGGVAAATIGFLVSRSYLRSLYHKRKTLEAKLNQVLETEHEEQNRLQVELIEIDKAIAQFESNKISKIGGFAVGGFMLGAAAGLAIEYVKNKK
jgi:hypothetical protein